MDSEAAGHHKSASDLAQSALRTQEHANEIGHHLGAIVEIGAAVVQVGLALDHNISQVGNLLRRRLNS